MKHNKNKKAELIETRGERGYQGRGGEGNGETVVREHRLLALRQVSSGD